VAEIYSNGYLERIAIRDNTLQGIHSGEFKGTIRPGHTFPEILKRLNTYKERGFNSLS